MDLFSGPMAARGGARGCVISHFRGSGQEGLAKKFRKNNRLWVGKGPRRCSNEAASARYAPEVCDIARLPLHVDFRANGASKFSAIFLRLYPAVKRQVTILGLRCARDGSRSP